MTNRPEKTLAEPRKRSGLVQRSLDLVRPDNVEKLGRSHALVDAVSEVRPHLFCRPEKFSAIVHELPPLFLRHWQELGTSREQIPLDPDWDRYFALEVNGALHIMTARSEGVLVGYIFNVVGPHLHYRSTLHAEIDMFWLDPAWRGTWFTLRWFRDNDHMLRGLGVKRVHVGTKNHFIAGRVGSIFRRLGYSPVETVWASVLAD